MLVISEVNIEFVKPANGLIGFASLVINESLYISSIAIHKKLNEDNYRLTYPSKGKFAIFHPINRNTSDLIEKAVFSKLKEVMVKRCNDYDRYSKNSNTFE